MKNLFKIGIVLGTRPEIIKLSPVVREIEKMKIDYFMIHTNQHFSRNMDAIFFKELRLKKPKYNLGINSVSHGEMVGRMFIEIEKVLLKEKPDWVIVQGDTNSAFAGAFIAQRLGIRVGHVEAGLRSYDRTMPEEINRIIIDHISDALFCPTKRQAKIALGEGIEKEKIFVTGNTIVDAVFQNIKLAEKLSSVKKYEGDNYFLLTMHRPSNVDNKKTLIRIIKSLEKISEKYSIEIIFPIHPRTRSRIEKFRIKLNNRLIKVIDPVGYLEMLLLEKYARLIITDSGGIQEEACILKVPCVTIRENTERPETIEVGSNTLVGSKQEAVIEGVSKMLRVRQNWENPFGNKESAQRIIKLLL